MVRSKLVTRFKAWLRYQSVFMLLILRKKSGKCFSILRQFPSPRSQEGNRGSNGSKSHLTIKVRWTPKREKKYKPEATEERKNQFSWFLCTFVSVIFKFRYSFFLTLFSFHYSSFFRSLTYSPDLDNLWDWIFLIHQADIPFSEKSEWTPDVRQISTGWFYNLDLDYLDH